jgi:UDP-N-acetylglucosamine 4,6-dehydratase
MKKKVLITGGSGFLGRNLAIKLKQDYEVVLGSRNNKQNFQAQNITGCQTLPLDVSNIESVRDLVRQVRPDIIIHAAATKFVDLSEKYPLETIDVNVVGSQNVARVAMDFGVEAVIGISTDKACPPIRNIYGMSKASMERMYCLLNGQSKTKFACVRYGNVAWSTGSVLPIWKKMHQETGVIGTTGPEMRRFFFTIEHAVQLVETAINNIELIQGQILSRVMKSAQVQDILDVWVKNFGGTWEQIDGRPGERLDEYLVGETELDYCETLVFSNIKHFLISPNTKVKTSYPEIFTSKEAERLTEEEILEIIKAQPDLL